MSAQIRLGTSSFTADGWNGSFYPKGMKSSEYLRYYSSRFDTVEVDSTFYHCPTAEVVNSWALRTPPGFVFSLKIPRTITHEKVLVECDKEFEEFVSTAQVLGEKLGPMVFQFPFFNDLVFSSPVQFVSLLQAFFKKLPRARGCRFAIEIRNKYWLKPRLLDLLRQNNVALVLQDQSWMPHPKDLGNYDLITADSSYIRWLGNRRCGHAAGGFAYRTHIPYFAREPDCCLDDFRIHIMRCTLELGRKSHTEGMSSALNLEHADR